MSQPNEDEIQIGRWPELTPQEQAIKMLESLPKHNEEDYMTDEELDAFLDRVQSRSFGGHVPK